jgi:repressor LexA
MAHTPPGETRDKVFRYVRDRLLAGTPPTVREVQDAMGFGAVESARKQLDALVAEGRLLKQPGRARSYRLPESSDGERAVRVPLLGRVQAGALHEAIEDADGYVVVESRYPARELFALRVRGDSMIDVGIHEDDVLVVRRQPSAEVGDTVVALVEGEATVKTFRRHRGRVVLAAANPAYEPLVFAPDEVTILGRVVEVRRRL